METEVRVEGLAELEARLLELDGLAGPKIVQRVLRKVARPLFVRAQQNAVAIGRSGALAKSIAFARRRTRGNEVAALAVTSKARDRVALAMAMAEYRQKRSGIFYGWMVDQGHKIGTRKSGALFRPGHGTRGFRGTVGAVRPRPWWTPAVTASEGAMAGAMVSELSKAIARIEARKSRTANPDTVVSA